MKFIGVVSVDKKAFNTFLNELGLYKKDDLSKYKIIEKLDDIRAVEFISVICAYRYSHSWNYKQDELFEKAKARIR